LFPNDFSTNERIKKNIITNENAQTNKRKIVLSDLDIVNHVNNVKYLEWCLDFVKTEKVLNQEIKCLNMNFLSELMLNEEIAISNDKNENSESFLIIKSGKICFSMVLDSVNIL
jgi:acyl-ACP thioesterase